MLNRGLWARDTESILNSPGDDRHFSSNTLWAAKMNDGQDVVLKCFHDRFAFDIERTAYSVLWGRWTAVDHFLGEDHLDGRPVLVLRRLVPLDWKSDNWELLLARALNLRCSLSLVSVPEAALGRIIPTVSANALLAPLKTWIEDRKDVVRFIVEVAMDDHQQLPLELCHGDFHPPNLLEDSEGQMKLIDWERCAMSPLERDLAAIVVGIAFRQPVERWALLFNRAQFLAHDTKLLACLILSEIVSLLEVFADDVGKTHGLTHMLEVFMKQTAEMWVQ